MCLIINLGILVLFKYWSFLIDNLNVLASALRLSPINRRFDVILPVGISFYTFQALSYVIDVYRKDTKVEKNFLRYALFISFFPQLVAGPIERSKRLLVQMRRVDSFQLWNYSRITDGLKTMLYGYFLKLVVADRVAIYVNEVFGNYAVYNSVALVTACVFFAIQIYCDFGSYSLIAIGSAKVLGFQLMDNFHAPYLARSTADFWRRWHISLSTWFRDYLYIPLGGSRRSKSRNALNLMIVFLVSGLWHGANWTFVVWGGLNGLFQLLGAWLKPVKDRINRRLNTKTDCLSYRLLQAVTTFILIDFTWIFFRADSLEQAFAIISRVFTRVDLWSLVNGGLISSVLVSGISALELTLAAAGIAVMLVVDILKVQTGKDLNALLATQNIWFRWAVYIAFIAATVVFGIYGSQFQSADFIYFQF